MGFGIPVYKTINDCHMKQLILVRHAKSDWGDPSLADIDRPLNERGKRDAPDMARRISKRKIRPDLLISSPAKRAARTARAFAGEFGFAKKDILYLPELYLAPPSVFFEVIAGISNDADTVLLFSHNEGITDFANQLGVARIDNIPTCGVFAIKADCKKWEAFRDAGKEFWFFDYPKSPGAD